MYKSIRALIIALFVLLGTTTYAQSDKELLLQEGLELQKKISEIKTLELVNQGHSYYEQGNYTQAAENWRKAAERGNALAQLSLGLCYEKGKGVAQSYSEATKWYRIAAEQGFAKAQYTLGICYAKGQGVTKSYSEAAKWIRKAAEQGDEHAQYQIGRCYEEGVGVEKSQTEAKKWYQKAAAQGHEGAKKKLNEM